MLNHMVFWHLVLALTFTKRAFKVKSSIRVIRIHLELHDVIFEKHIIS